jgi:hypothetical protein
MVPELSPSTGLMSLVMLCILTNSYCRRGGQTSPCPCHPHPRNGPSGPSADPALNPLRTNVASPQFWACYTAEYHPRLFSLTLADAAAMGGTARLHSRVFSNYYCLIAFLYPLLLPPSTASLIAIAPGELPLPRVNSFMVLSLRLSSLWRLWRPAGDS